MTNSKLIIIITNVFLGFTSTSYAVSADLTVEDKPIPGIQKNHTMISAKAVLNYSKVLLMNSPVAHKLKISNNQIDKANFAEAEKIYREASRAYDAGSDAQAKKLALESIRVIARSIPRYNNNDDQATR